MRRFLTDPLIHFLLLGTAFFIVFQWVGQDHEPAPDSVISVDQATLLTFLQYRHNVFNTENAATYFDQLSPVERAELVDAYFREEALFREAQALGLDEEDYIARQRLVQRLEFLLRGLSADATPPSEADRIAYYEANKQDYALPERLTFSHIFFDPDQRGWDLAKADARALRQKLQDQDAGMDAAFGQGDRFLYHQTYADKALRDLEGHFDGTFTASLTDVQTPLGQWVGPLTSDHGVHLLWIAQRKPSEIPPLEALKPLIDDAITRTRRNKTLGQAVDQVLGRYELKLSDDVYHRAENGEP